MNDYQDLGAILDEAGRGQPDDGMEAGLPTAALAAPFRDFQVADWCAFSGCCSDNPKIAELDGHGVAIVVDSAAITAVHFEGAAVDVHVRSFKSGPEAAAACARSLAALLEAAGIDEVTDLLVEVLGPRTGGL